MRRKYSFYVCGYVVMPEHVHILLREPDRKTLAAALQSIKQKTFRLSPIFPKKPSPMGLLSQRSYGRASTATVERPCGLDKILID
jgi:REP element-mobilizing transposase RayT